MQTTILLYRILFVLGYVLLVPGLAIFWYTGGRHMDKTQRRSLWLMAAGLVMVFAAALLTPDT